MLYTGDMPKEYITTTEAGKMLGVGDQRIRDLIKAGRLKATKVLDGIWAVEVESVRNFQRRKPGRKPKKST